MTYQDSLIQKLKGQPYEQGGITGGVQGGTAVNVPPIQAPAPEPTPSPTPAPQAKANALGQYANRLEGFDSTKLNSGHNSPKYQIARALSNFDPRQGVTPDVLAALNGLGIGQFSGSGDKVSIANGDPRFEGVNSIDLVRVFHDPNGTGGWQYGAEGLAPAAAAPRAGIGGGGGGFGLPGLLQGDPNAGIQQALQNIGGLQSSGMLQQLIAALSGGR